MGNCASSRGHSGILDVNVSTQPDCVDALPGDATLDTDKSVGKSLYTTGKAQRAYSLKLDNKLKLAEALVAGGLDRSVRGGALGERSIKAERSVRGGGDRSVRGGSLAYGGGGGGGAAVTGERSSRGSGALYASSAQDRSHRPDRSFHRGSAYANTPNQQQPKAAVSLAAAAAAGHGLAPALMTVNTYAEPLRPMPFDSSSTCEDAYAGGVVTDSVSRPGAAVELHRLHHCNSRDVGGSASLMVGPGSSTARISGGGANASGGTHLANGNVSQGLGRTGSGGVSYGRRSSSHISSSRAAHHRPESCRLLRQSLTQMGVEVEAGGCLVNDVEDVEDVEEHELAVEAVVAEPGIASRRGAAQAAPPRSHSTGTLVAQQQAHQAAGTWGGSLLSPAIPHPAATPVIACSQAGSPTPAAGSPFNGAASIAAAAMGSYASVGVQVTTGSAAAPPAAAVTANGGRRFLGKARPQVDLAAQPKASHRRNNVRPALKGSPLSGAAHSLFRPPSCAPDISMTEVQALPATAPTPQQPQQPPSARLGGMRLQTSPGNLGDYDGSHELLGTIQQPAAAAALSTSLDGGAIQSSSTTGAGASTAAAAPAPAEGRQLQPPALATRLRVQTQQGRAAAGQPACDELLPGSPSARAAACAQQQEPPQQLPQHVISLGQVTASMLASPSSSALTGSCWREALSSPRASPRASGRVHPAPPPAALAADSSSPISSRRQQAGSFQRASSTYPCSSPTDAAPPPATRHQQQSLYDSTGAGATLTAHALGAFSPVQGAVGAQVGVGGSRIGSPHAAPGAGGGGGTGQKLVAELRAISGQLPSSVEAAEKGPSAAGGFLDDLPGGVPDDEE
eukprot:XP_001694883.1 predicted protein [Chlamydomonas reinhardtii]